MFKPIYMSSNNLIIDGHHRYISSLITGFDIEVVTDYPEPTDVNEINWNTVQFLEEDSLRILNTPLELI